MSLNITKKSLAAILGLTVAALALPALADNDGNRRGDCQQGGNQMRHGHMGNGMGQGMGQGMMGQDGMGQGMGQGKGRRNQMSQGAGGRHLMERFGIIDQNDDGKISDDEAAAQRESVFAAMDADDDQELTEDEFMGVFMGQGDSGNNERVEKHQQAKKARFAPMDSDNSGKVSKAEWMAEGQARFAAADSDSDGVVTPWEFRSRQR